MITGSPFSNVIASDNLSASDVSFLRALVLERSAIVLDESKHYLLAGRLDPVVRKEKLSSIGELVDQVKRNPRGRMENLVIEVMTTNETSFFRDVHRRPAVSPRRCSSVHGAGTGG